MRTQTHEYNDILAMLDGLAEGFTLEGELEGIECSPGRAAPSPEAEQEACDYVDASCWYTQGEGIVDTSTFHASTLPERLDDEFASQREWDSRMEAVAASTRGHEHFLYLWHRKQERLERFERLKAWAQGQTKSALQRMIAGAWERYRSSVQRDYEVFDFVAGAKRRIIHKVDNSGIYLTRQQLDELQALVK